MSNHNAGQDQAGCLFCQVAAGRLKAHLVLDEPEVLVFLDHRPLFPGHCLVIPRQHYQDLAGLPPALANRLFEVARGLSGAMIDGLRAEGAFVAINNRVSQSVPHVHIHVVPRRKGDGLKGFFWPRRKYLDEGEAQATRAAVSSALQRILTSGFHS